MAQARLEVMMVPQCWRASHQRWYEDVLLNPRYSETAIPMRVTGSTGITSALHPASSKRITTSTDHSATIPSSRQESESM